MFLHVSSLNISPDNNLRNREKLQNTTIDRLQFTLAFLYQWSEGREQYI